MQSHLSWETVKLSQRADKRSLLLNAVHHVARRCLGVCHRASGCIDLFSSEGLSCELYVGVTAGVAQKHFMKAL